MGRQTHISGDPTTVPVVILCGGKGTRIRESGIFVPKPMLPIGGIPIVVHIMKLYVEHGFSNFVLALGYLGDVIKTYFLNYEALTRDFTIELGRSEAITFLRNSADEGWRITCIDTGADALTGTRLRRAVAHLPPGPVMVTYGDGVGDVDIAALFRFHCSHGGKATMTAVHPPGRFGELLVDADGRVSMFEEKPQTSSGAINGGFMVLDRDAIDDYIPADRDVMLEREPLNSLASDGELWAFPHRGFWQPMDTPRERDLLQELWDSGAAPWKTWQ